MRHNRKGRQLSRTTSHRRAMLRNLVTSLFEHERVTTTVAKAKEARPVAERLITRARAGGLAARRYVSSYVMNEDVAKKLMEDIAPRFATRPGGYTRIFKAGLRHGDSGEIGIIELVERKIVKPAKEDGKKAAAKKGKGEELTAEAAAEKAEKAKDRAKDKADKAVAKAEKKAAKKAGVPLREERVPGRRTKGAMHAKHTQATRKSGGSQKSSKEG
jgi:large subunit ribosomal protein L17